MKIITDEQMEEFEKMLSKIHQYPIVLKLKSLMDFDTYLENLMNKKKFQLQTKTFFKEILKDG